MSEIRTYNRSISLVRTSLRDQLHEPLMTGCLVVSIVAALVPLLLLYSVKVGFVERIRADLISDPTYREIQPARADIKPPDTLAGYHQLAGVAFVIPSVMLVPREVLLVTETSGRKKSEQVRLIPTDVGDPLLDRIEGSFVADDSDAIIVSADIAEAHGLQIGQDVQLHVARTENRRTRRVIVDARVSGILPAETLGLPSILASSRLDVAVEEYRSGIGVPERGWAPVPRVPKQLYRLILIASPNPLDEVQLREFLISVGGVTLEKIADPHSGYGPVYQLFGLGPDYVNRPQFSIRDGMHYFYALQNYHATPVPGRYYSASDVREAANLAQPFSGRVFGVNSPWVLTVGGETLNAIATDPRLFTGMRKFFYPWRFGTQAEFEANSEIYVSPGAGIANQKVSGTFHPRDFDDGPVFEHAGTSGIRHPLVVSLNAKSQEGISTGDALVSSALIGMLSRSGQVQLEIDHKHKIIVEKTVGFRGFRMVAETLEDVPRLVAHFESIGVPVRAKSAAIIKLQRLDRSLNLLVFAVGLVALLGGISVVGATYVSNVKRKSLYFATFRLIGASRLQVFQIPIIQALIVSLVGFLISCLIFVVASYVINDYVAGLVDFDGELSRLEWSHILVAAAIVVLGSASASLFAAAEAMSIDPSVALRGETS